MEWMELWSGVVLTAQDRGMMVTQVAHCKVNWQTAALLPTKPVCVPTLHFLLARGLFWKDRHAFKRWRFRKSPGRMQAWNVGSKQCYNLFATGKRKHNYDDILLLLYPGCRMGNGLGSQNLQAVITSFAVQSIEALSAAREHIPPL
jgi:hypothetical protein